jgi:hypothetical protein
MELIKFIMWLSAGAVLGWFASRLDQVVLQRIHEPMSGEDRGSE